MINFAPGGGDSINPALLAALLGKSGGTAGVGSEAELALQKMMLQPYTKDMAETGPVGHWTAALARAVNGGIAHHRLNKLIDDSRKSEAQTASTLSNLPGLGGSPASSGVPSIPLGEPPAPAKNPLGALGGLLGGLGGGIGGEGGGAPSGEMAGSVLPPQALAAGLAQPPQMSAMAGPMDGGMEKPLAMQQPPFMGGGFSEPVVPSQLPMPPQRPGTIDPSQLASTFSPQPMADQPANLTGGNPSQGIDRSRIAQELQANPHLINKLAGMVKGETGFRDPQLATIQTESAMNRALARGIPLDQALLAVNESPKGYYASDTYKRPASPAETNSFQRDILAKVLAGSDVGTETTGFPVTGNGSQISFAGRRAAEGKYDAFKWYSGQPGKGEMYVTEKGDAKRFAQNVKSNFPAELLSPQSDAERLNSFAPVKVASDDPGAGVPPMPSSPPVGSFAPGALPNVPEAAVRPTGPQGAQPAPQGPPPVAPSQPIPLPPGTPGAQRSAVNIPPEVANTIRTLMLRPSTRAEGLKLYHEYAKPTDRFEEIKDPKGNVIGQRSSLTNEKKADPTRPDYQIQNRADGAIVSVNKNNPQDFSVIKPPGATTDLSTQAGEVKRQEEKGQVLGKGDAAVPGALENAQFIKKTISEIENHPGLKWGTGLTGTVMRHIPGTHEYDFQSSLDQLKGRAFLDAFESLRGGGQISNVEGDKATAAKARLDAAQSEPAFRSALKDYIDVVNSALNRTLTISRTSPESAAAIIKDTGPGKSPMVDEKVVGGKTYYKQGNQWFER